jgi:hypothetical protein
MNIQQKMPFQRSWGWQVPIQSGFGFEFANEQLAFEDYQGRLGYSVFEI